MQSGRVRFTSCVSKQVVAVALALLVLVAGCGGSEEADPNASVPAATVAQATPDIEEQPPPSPAPETEEVDTSPPATEAPADGQAPSAPIVETPEPGGVVLLDAGAEPRVELRISEASTQTIMVTVEETSTGTVGDDSVDERESAEFVVQVVVAPGAADGSDATIVPTILSLDATTPAPTDRQVGPLEWTLDRNGQIIAASGPDLTGTPVVAAATLIAVPELFAIVPSEAVGVGAQWQYALSPTTIFTVDLTAVSDDAVELSVEFVHSDEEGTVTSSTIGSYGRTSLLAIDVDMKLLTEFTAPTTRSGEVIDIEGVYEVTRSYAMEAQS